MQDKPNTNPPKSRELEFDKDAYIAAIIKAHKTKTDYVKGESN